MAKFRGDAQAEVISVEMNFDDIPEIMPPLSVIEFGNGREPLGCGVAVELGKK